MHTMVRPDIAHVVGAENIVTLSSGFSGISRVLPSCACVSAMARPCLRDTLM